MTVITIDRGFAGHRRRIVLADVTVTFDSPVTVLVGQNGSGKSTLLATLATAIRPKGGDFAISGHSASSRDGRAWIRRNVAWLPQHMTVPPGMTVQELVEYARWLKGHSGTTPGQVQRALNQVALDNRASDRVDRLSGGLARRACLAAVYSCEPELLLLDEPTAGIDEDSRDEFLRFLDGWGSAGRTVVIASHHPDELSKVDAAFFSVSDGGIHRLTHSSDGDLGRRS